MSAPDFYFAIHAIARHIHDRYGKAALVDYWRNLGREYYADRIAAWKAGGAAAIVRDWKEYFAHEPGAQIDIRQEDGGAVLDVKVCPAIKHLRDSGREIVPYFCEHCDHVGGAMAQAAGFKLERTGGMGACVQRFVPLRVTE